jgi:DNA-binding LacI/PurR family transcriptional regulator
MSLVTLSWEQWGIVSETFHGLNEVADANGASVLFRHLSEAEDRLLAKGRAPDWVDDVDAAVFMSEQLSTLRTVLSARGIPCVVLEHESSDRSSGLSTVNYDRSQALTEIARFLHERGYREVGILGDTTALCQLKKRLFIASALEFGLRVKTEACFDLDCDTAQAARDAVAGAFPDRESLPEVFFLANSTLAPSALLQTAWDRHWRIGEDFGVIGMASKVAFSNTIPSITYYQVPRCEMGRVACNLAIDLAQEATPSHAVARHAVVQGRIIPGASTR